MKSAPELARDTLKTLVQRKLPPTPANYTLIFNEISGATETPDDGAILVLHNLATQLLSSEQFSEQGSALQKLLDEEKWDQCSKQLSTLLPKSATATPQNWPSLIQNLLRQMELSHKGLTSARKKDSLNTVLGRFSSKPEILFEKLGNLIHSWSEAPTTINLVDSNDTPADITPNNPAAIPARGMSGGTPSLIDDPAAIPAGGMSGGTPSLIDDPSASPARGMSGRTPSLRDDPSASPAGGMSGGTPSLRDDPSAIINQLAELLAQSLESNLITQPELGNEVGNLTAKVRTLSTSGDIDTLSGQLHPFWLKLELHGTEKVRIQEGLVRLLRLLIANIDEMVDDEDWLHGQIQTLSEIIQKPLDRRVIADAERSLRESIIKQGLLKSSLDDTKATLKDLMTTFIDRLGSITVSTGDYHQKIADYSHQIAKSNNLNELGHLLDDIMQDTRVIQSSSQRSHEELVSAHKQVEISDAKIRQLEQELSVVSELIQHDQLTGALNRRGLDEAFEREATRVDRTHAPLCVALLDIDDFKRLNDTLGHQVGDKALIHMCEVIREALRPSDSVARYGGEEFVIILPDVELNEAANTVERLQRELTKQYFLHEKERVLVTFSSGVAQRGENETQEAVIGRADKAMYQAKHTGKNRVIMAK